MFQRLQSHQMFALFLLLYFAVSGCYNASCCWNKLGFEINKKYSHGDLKKFPQGSLGLRVDDLVSRGKLSLAKKLLQKVVPDRKFPRHVIHWRLAQINARQGNSMEFRENFNHINKDDCLKYYDMIAALYDELPVPDRKWLVKRLIKLGFFVPRKKNLCPHFLSHKRSKRAKFVFRLTNENKLPKTVRHLIWRELYVLKPEVILEAELKKSPSLKEFFNFVKTKDIIDRANALLNFGRNDEALNSLENHLEHESEVLLEQRCEIEYLRAKIYRRRKKYEVARAAFHEISRGSCPYETRIKARYMDLYLATLMTDEESLDKFDDFVRYFPNHSFCDDILLFKANLLMELGRLLEAQSVLGTLISDYPHGDMLKRALFLSAFNWMKLGKNERAHEDLNSLAIKSKKNSLEYAQARYWMARLMLFPDLNSMSGSGEKTVAAKKILEDLLNSQSFSIYSWLSILLLQTIGEKPSLVWSQQTESNEIGILSRVFKGELAEIFALAANGFKREAVTFLDDLVIDPGDVNRTIAMAQSYLLLNRPILGHQKLIRCDSTVGLQLAEMAPKIFIELSYPKGFGPELDIATVRVGLKKNIILSLIREESGFVSQSCSWAGAKGLMQMLYPSALEQSKKLGIKNLQEEDLYDPVINTLLASSLFKSYWQRFSNLVLGICAYNAGPVAAKKWAAQHRNLPLDTFIESIPFKDTRRYVKDVLGATFAYSRILGDETLPPLDLRALLSH